MSTPFYIGGLDMSYPLLEARGQNASDEWAIATLVVLNVKTAQASGPSGSHHRP